ncbi:dTDP-4-dehydrorhamnose reductase [Flavobacterium sp. MC2016-06]|jgi:dTDP-4-dehydrorhamnose reductase|uniref:dTDP-4-dehydrorhamnose reductase n=1 Tax=Flavobacterium sp. MC2016-06 TaxID=2676308 RepID=UPI0012BAA8BF|nr:dTDP-4-dehydrorhamnose reductase [Flavobacterium sp. MC2016-06]MBU3858650.1 dTDP-4-dehydrorhamnose reductase [Flavobacterium sp. MC2016-06]
MEKILVTGSNGQLGSELKVLSENYSQFEWVFADRNQVSLDNLADLENQLELINPNVVINCAAYTAVDKAESEEEFADIINHLAVGVLADWSHENNAKLIHISTDYVFDGTSSFALNEDSPTKPINVYGATKLLGEIFCLKNNPNAVIIRTSWVYSSFGNNFVKTMSRLMQERDSLNVVNDQIGSPTYAADLAKAIVDIITHSDWKSGIYNFSNEGEISWYEFALAIKEIGDYNCEVSGIPSSAYPTPAKRPAYSLLDKSKIKDSYNVIVPNYKESLKKMMSL